MKDAILDLLASKKGIMALLTILAWVLARFGFSMDPEVLAPPLYIIIAYLIGQGLADVGKEAKKR